MDNEKLRVIPKKNYLILGIIIIITILLVYYMYMWSVTYNETKLNIPILDKYMEVINYNELDDYLVEMPNTVIYVSILENSEIREFEKKFKNVVKNNKLNMNVLYMDITDDIKNNIIKNEMDMKYTIGNKKMSDVPSVVVIENGVLRDIYSIKDNNYDQNEVMSFINKIKFKSEDDING